LRSIQFDELTQRENEDNSIIEEKENEESTKHSRKDNKSSMFPDIKY
jgi:hypothetical protein